jgi:DNA-binding MarR family transcriptional regulator
MLRWSVSSFDEPPLFGDVLARARQRWINEMARRLARRGYLDYRRSDAFALRFLAVGPHALGAFAAPLGGSRQAARKVVTGLVERGFATVDADPNDLRRRSVRLTRAGREYAAAVSKVIYELNGELAAGVDAHELATAISVLTFVSEELLA